MEDGDPWRKLDTTEYTRHKSTDDARLTGRGPRICLTIYVKPALKYSMATTDTAENSSPVEDARDELQDAVPKAAETLRDLLDAEDERVQIRAAEAILDRAGLTKAKMQSSATKAQVQIGGGERSG
jgi:hypothetical protein